MPCIKGSGGIAPLILHFAVSGGDGEWSASRSGGFTPEERVSDTR
jgi:hypothetical protein